jgi:glycerol uptake facilitator-like aquaporin
MAHISKAHLNPAVTFSLVVIGDLNVPLAGVYIVSQVIGATLGYGVLMVSQRISIQGTQIRYLFWNVTISVVTPRSLALLGMEFAGSRVLQNTGNHVSHYAVSQPKTTHNLNIHSNNGHDFS